MMLSELSSLIRAPYPPRASSLPHPVLPLRLPPTPLLTLLF